MKKIIYIAFIIMIGLSILSDFSSLKATPIVDITYMGLGDYYQTRKVAGTDIYTGIYRLNVNSNPWEGFCIDIWGRISGGNSWQAYWFSPSDISSSMDPSPKNGNLFSHFSVAKAKENYQMVGWIFNNKYPTANTNDAFADFHEALLYAASYSGTWGSSWTFDATNWHSDTDVTNILQDAVDANAYNAGIYPYLYTPKSGSYSGNSAQEFVNPIPEPGTIFLFGIGLIGFGFLTRFRRRKM